MMKLNLRDLHIDILKHNRTYDVFDYSHNGIQFSVMFDVDSPVYNFINDRLVDESAVLRPLS